MKAEELRLGNLCSVYNKEYKTEKEYQIDIDDIVMLLTGRVIITPIKLTPSWLERMGLPKDGSTLGINMDYALCFERIKDKVFLVTSDNQIVLKIDFVHTFQNVYYHLNKGKEIEIKQ